MTRLIGYTAHYKLMVCYCSVALSIFYNILSLLLLQYITWQFLTLFTQHKLIN